MMFVFETLLAVLGQFVLRGTGEFLLFVGTLGRRKPRIGSMLKKRGFIAEELFSEAGFWVGLAFYGALLLAANALLAR